MISRPYLSDYRLISYYTGRIIIGLALLMLVPLCTALLCRELAPFVDFLLSFGLTAIVGIFFLILGEKKMQVRWVHAMVIGAFSWLIAMLLAAVPHYLSGHFLSYLDACFDVMSGFTTTGLVLIQDMDHLADSFNMWRHLLTYLGGQGMIVLVLTFLMRGTAGAYMMYVGEGKDEKLLPNVVQTTRAIWIISIIYLIIGTSTLTLAAHWDGMFSLPRALLHGLWLFMTSWSTGGFGAQSLNLLYYHSLAIESIVFLFMVLGSFNFILHFSVWSGKRTEIWKNIEIVSFVTTVTVTFCLLTYALIKMNIYSDVISLFRRGAFILVSGHTTTGVQNIYTQQFILDWGHPAMLAVIIAMAIGASACSTAGGFKGLRMGIIFKGFLHELKRIVLPENSVFVTKYHHIKDLILSDQTVKMAAMIVLSYMGLYLTGALIGVQHGYPFINSLFDSVSAGSNVGLSCGITAATMPTDLKLYYIFAMWAGRLEFISIFGLIAFVVAIFKGK